MSRVRSEVRAKLKLTMPLPVLQQPARGLPVLAAASIQNPADGGSAEEESLERQVESVRHYPWQGGTSKAPERLGRLGDDRAAGLARS